MKIYIMSFFTAICMTGSAQNTNDQKLILSIERKVAEIDSLVSEMEKKHQGACKEESGFWEVIINEKLAKWGMMSSVEGHHIQSIMYADSSETLIYSRSLFKDFMMVERFFKNGKVHFKKISGNVNHLPEELRRKIIEKM